MLGPHLAGRIELDTSALSHCPKQSSKSDHSTGNSVGRFNHQLRVVLSGLRTGLHITEERSQRRDLHSTCKYQKQML